MSFEEALAAASRDEGFKATVYAMNTLLIRKGVYTQEEFQSFFVEWVEKELRQKRRDDPRSHSEKFSENDVRNFAWSTEFRYRKPGTPTGKAGHALFVARSF